MSQVCIAIGVFSISGSILKLTLKQFTSIINLKVSFQSDSRAHSESLLPNAAHKDKVHLASGSGFNPSVTEERGCFFFRNEKVNVEGKKNII